MKTLLRLLLLLTVVGPVRGEDSLSAKPASELIDDLALIDAPAPGLHGTASVLGFIGEDKPLQFGGGIIGSARPIVPPAMRELARRGASALPDLIAHLDDARPTKLTQQKSIMVSYFTDEYDPKIRPKGWDYFNNIQRDKPQKGLDHDYTVRIGDVCYAIIGQIVNRNLLAIRYQPTAILIINSPLETPVLIDRVKQDWSGVDAAALQASLITDAQSGNPFTVRPALERLRFYYPDTYATLKTGTLKKEITAFEADETKRR